MNSPQKPAYGLYAEKLSGTAFTVPRQDNLQTWLYRILPSSAHSTFQPLSDAESTLYAPEKFHQIPNQLRWDPFDLDHEADWVHSFHMIAGAGDATLKTGLGIYIFAAGQDMPDKQAFYSADGDLLIVLQVGVLDIQTELGWLLVRTNEICVIPRGIRHRVTLPEGVTRGYILELYQGQFQLPELGPIGSNGLANRRDFQYPVASFDQDHSSSSSKWTILAKFANKLYTAHQPHTPFDVVAWHGTYSPYKYDLSRFNTIGSISYDHPDPSIFTVLTAPSHISPGVAICDFVIFPPRWLVAENTFRPPFFHRNVMSEFMGLISGEYDAKQGGKGGFRPGGASLHNIMSAHGPDQQTCEKATNGELQPVKVGKDGKGMAFMFESCYMLGTTEWGLRTCEKVQEGYGRDSWEGLQVYFTPPPDVPIRDGRL